MQLFRVLRPRCRLAVRAAPWRDTSPFRQPQRSCTHCATNYRHRLDSHRNALCRFSLNAANPSKSNPPARRLSSLHPGGQTPPSRRLSWFWPALEWLPTSTRERLPEKIQLRPCAAAADRTQSQSDVNQQDLETCRKVPMPFGRNCRNNLRVLR